MVTSKFAETTPNHKREYYATIETKEGSELIPSYKTKFRHEAEDIFQEVARLRRGKLGVINTY